MPVLDGIRGLAILGVVGSHLFRGNYSGSIQWAFRHVLDFGATGVDLFFVLSGFLITGILYDSLGEQRFFTKFYARRALRIFPLYYGVLLVFAIYGLAKGLSWHGQLLSLALYAQNTSWVATPFWAYTQHPLLPLGHFWSLAIEEQFYFVWPMLVFLLRDRRRLLMVCCFASAASPLLRFLLMRHGEAYLSMDGNTFCRADSLLGGAALSLLLRGPAHDAMLRAAAWIFGAGVFLLLSARLLMPWLLTGNTAYAMGLAIEKSALMLLYVGFITCALRFSPVRQAFSVALLRTFGKYSYGLYVLHLILITYLDPPLRSVLYGLLMNRKTGAAISDILLLFMSTVVAVLSYQLYERHFLRLKRFFDYRPHTPPVAQ